MKYMYVLCIYACAYMYFDMYGHISHNVIYAINDGFERPFVKLKDLKYVVFFQT